MCVCVLLFIVSPPENTLHHIMAKELTLLRILRKRQLFHCNFSQNVTHPFNKPFPVPLPFDRLKNNNKRDKQFRLYCIWIPNTVYNLGVCLCVCAFGGQLLPWLMTTFHPTYFVKLSRSTWCHTKLGKRDQCIIITNSCSQCMLRRFYTINGKPKQQHRNIARM